MGRQTLAITDQERGHRGLAALGCAENGSWCGLSTNQMAKIDDDDNGGGDGDDGYNGYCGRQWQCSW